jgi:hypothetical protein
LAAAVFYPKVDRAVVSLLSKADWSWSYVSTVDSRGRTIFVADAHHTTVAPLLSEHKLDGLVRWRT